MNPRHLQAVAWTLLSAALCATAASCGGGNERPSYDWRNRELAWKYGPTTGTASPQHLLGTGTKRGAPIAEGWKVDLSEGAKLTVRPYKLAAQHELFGKAGLIVALYDKASQQIEVLRTPAIGPGQATFTLDVDPAVAKATYDLILWYGEA
jgi:hypothetical protein